MEEDASILSQQYQSLKESAFHMNLKEQLTKRNFRIEFALTFVILITTLFALTRFLNSVEKREGVIFSDPILVLFNPVDLTWLTFTFIYASIFTSIFVLMKDLPRMAFVFQCYVVMVWIRMIAMYLVPLDPPETMIALNDPFVEIFGTGQLLTRDLFFSGHTATLLLLFLVMKKKLYRKLLLLSTMAVAVTVLLQHVHYTIDVYAAVFFGYGAYRITKKLRMKFGINPGFNYC